MKRAISVLLAAAILICAFSSCEKIPSESPETGSFSENNFTAENEIFTYQKIDPEKTQLVVSRTGNIPVEKFCREFEEKNPDIQIIYLDITGGNSYYNPFLDWITKGYCPDITFSSSSFLSDLSAPDYFVDLSANPVIQRFESEALQRTAFNGFAYILPGPSNIFAIMYNKTLFAEYGWEVPKTFEEFVALCGKITEDTNGSVEPWNPNAKYDNELLTALEAMCYGEIFGGTENRLWYNNFIDEKATFYGHMEPFYDMIQILVDNDILREEHFTYSATARGKEFSEGKIAMISGNIYDADNDSFDFGFMPFPSTNGGLGYISDSYSCYVAVPKKEHSEAELDAIQRFLEYFSSEEGQNFYIGNSLTISAVKDVAITGSDELSALQPVVDAGHMFAPLNFTSASGKQRIFSFQQGAIDIASGKKTAAECISEVDAEPYIEPTAASEKTPEAIASVSEDMTILETSFYIADMYREKANADIGLINNNIAYRGNLIRLYSGNILGEQISPIKPRSFANDSSLVKLSMSGKQILEALNNPLGYEGVSDSVYAFSGLCCEVAPWNPLGEKYLSVKLADGSELEPDKLYTVAAWAGTIGEEYITETLETFEGTWEELMTEKMTTDGVISPPDDGRITLVWDSSKN